MGWGVDGNVVVQSNSLVGVAGVQSLLYPAQRRKRAWRKNSACAGSCGKKKGRGVKGGCGGRVNMEERPGWAPRHAIRGRLVALLSVYSLVSGRREESRPSLPSALS